MTLGINDPPAPPVLSSDGLVVALTERAGPNHFTGGGGVLRASTVALRNRVMRSVVVKQKHTHLDCNRQRVGDLPVMFLQWHRGAHRLKHVCAVPSGEFAQSVLQTWHQLSVTQQTLDFIHPYDNRGSSHGSEGSLAKNADLYKVRI